MLNLTNEQQQKLAAVLKDYLNANDWKSLFSETNCEEFVQQNTQFYDNVSWEDDNPDNTLENDCNAALAFILEKDSINLRTIWEVPGVETMTRRQDETLYTEIETLLNQVDTQTTTSTDNSYIDTIINQTPHQTLDDAENRLITGDIKEAVVFIQAAIRNYLQHSCRDNEIATESGDSLSLLHAKILDYLKRKDPENQNTLLRTTSNVVDSLEELGEQNQTFKHADLRYAINQSRAMMVYFDERLV